LKREKKNKKRKKKNLNEHVICNIFQISTNSKIISPLFCYVSSLAKHNQKHFFNHLYNN